MLPFGVNNRVKKSAFFALVLCLLPMVTVAQTTSDEELVKMIGNEFENTIAMLNNRFRIDQDVDAVTMVFFRKKGATPVVLVRPDGSKLFREKDEEDDSYSWADGETFDMIKVSNPMPGPWQAVGQILPGSRVMVVADITLEVSDLPKEMFVGEVIKQESKLRNNGKQINFAPFKDVVELTVDFLSSNNPNFDNFGLGAFSVGRFEDNGTDFDEFANDGTFTGDLVLNLPAGEWIPSFKVITPMFEREQMKPPVVVHPSPLIFDVEIDEKARTEHVVSIDVNRDLIDMNSLLFSGTLRMPNGTEKDLAYTNVGEQVKFIYIDSTDYGIYRINLTAFARTLDGRDIIVNVPEFRFETKAPLPPPQPVVRFKTDPETGLFYIDQDGNRILLPDLPVKEYLLDENGDQILDGRGMPISAKYLMDEEGEYVLDDSFEEMPIPVEYIYGENGVPLFDGAGRPMIVEYYQDEDGELLLDENEQAIQITYEKDEAGAFLFDQNGFPIPQPAPEKPLNMILLIIVSNSLLLLVGAGVLVSIAHIRKHPDDHWFKRMKTKFSKAKKKTKKRSEDSPAGTSE